MLKYANDAGVSETEFHFTAQTLALVRENPTPSIDDAKRDSVAAIQRLQESDLLAVLVLHVWDFDLQHFSFDRLATYQAIATNANVLVRECSRFSLGGMEHLLFFVKSAHVTDDELLAMAPPKRVGACPEFRTL